MEWSIKQIAACLWLVEHLDEKSNGEEFGAYEALPLKEKIKYVKNYVGFDKIADEVKSKLTEEEVEKILFGYEDRKNYEGSLGFDEDQTRFLQATLCWIGGYNYFNCFSGMPFEKKLSKIKPIREIEYVEIIYHLTQNESSDSNNNGWLNYKNKCASDYKYKSNWSVDYITSPGNADEAIGALAFLKDIEDTDTIQLLINICKEQFSENPLVERYLPKYEKFLVDYANKQKENEAEMEECAKESEAEDKKKMRRLLYMFLICVLAIIAIGVEVWLLQWWAILSGLLTLLVPISLLIYYSNE